METTITTIRKERRVHFALCGSCYWCASYLDGRAIEKCPGCGGERIESIPVAGNEMYVFDYDERRGVTVDFLPAKT